MYPREVVSALATQGWSMGMGQQDSHELFFALISSLEDQTSPPSRPQDVLQELVQEEAMPTLPRPLLLDNGSISSKGDSNDMSKVASANII